MVERAIRDDGGDIDLPDLQEHAASIETGAAVCTHAHADWGFADMYVFSVYNPRYRNAWLNRDIALRSNAAVLGMSRCIARIVMSRIVMSVKVIDQILR